MATVSIQFQIDDSSLEHWTDQYLAQLWHIAQANPAPFGDAAACDFAERVGREIIRRFVSNQSPELWHHQARHAEAARRDGQCNQPGEAANHG